MGKALLNYERARFFLPSDSDLKANYNYVLSLLNTGGQVSGNWFERAVNRLFAGVTVNFLTILLALVYVLVIISFSLNLFFSGFKPVIKPVIFSLVIIFILAIVSLQGKIAYFNHGAIVTSKDADIKFEPLESATTYFKLNEGSNVEVIEEAGNWYKIKRTDGRLGWVNKGTLGLIFTDFSTGKM